MEEVEKASRFFQRHGQWVVFALRFSPFLRTIISLPAGLTHMHKGWFLLLTAAGSAIWNAALISGGRLLGDRLEDAELIIGWLTIAAVVALVCWYVWRVTHWTPKS